MAERNQIFQNTYCNFVYVTYHLVEVSVDSVKSGIDEIRDVVFQEIQVRLSDTWEGFERWLGEKYEGLTIDGIEEDEDLCDFYHSGRPGALQWPVEVSGKRGGLPFSQTYDLVHWLHKCAKDLAPSDAGIPWETGLFPEKDEKGNPRRIEREHVRLRDGTYYVTFASL